MSKFVIEGVILWEMAKAIAQRIASEED